MAIASFLIMRIPENYELYVYMITLKKKGVIQMDNDIIRDLVEQSNFNESEDDFGFRDAYGISWDEYEEEWN